MPSRPTRRAVPPEGNRSRQRPNPRYPATGTDDALRRFPSRQPPFNVCQAGAPPTSTETTSTMRASALIFGKRMRGLARSPHHRSS